MTALQIIQEIQVLPTEEQEEVIRAVQLNLQAKNTPPTIRYVSKEEAKRVSESIFVEYAYLFRKLAQ